MKSNNIKDTKQVTKRENIETRKDLFQRYAEYYQIHTTGSSLLKTLPRIKLPNGMVVVNFASEHDFIFDLGERGTITLKGVDTTTRQLMNIQEARLQIPNPRGWIDIVYIYKLSPTALATLQALHEDPSTDIILMSAPMITIVQEQHKELALKCRVPYINKDDKTTGDITIKWNQFFVNPKR